MKIPIVIFLLLFAFTVSAQVDEREKFDMDIALIGGVSLKRHRSLKDKRIGLQFRKRIGKSLIFKASVVSNKVAIRHYSAEDLPVFLSDSLQIFRTYSVLSRKQYLFRTGVDFDFSKYILLGANLIMGWSPAISSFYDMGFSSRDQGVSWSRCAPCGWEYHGQVAPSSSNISSQPPVYGESVGESTYLIYGTSVNLGLQLPILKRFAVGVQYEPQLLRFHHKQDSNAWPAGAFASFTSVRHFTDAFVRFGF